MRVTAVLAGGASTRMGGRDKACLDLNGKRLIDRVIDRLGPQSDLMVISGPRDYGTGLPVIPDAPDGLKGPAAGVLAVSNWLARHPSQCPGFYTCSVDSPFPPDDLTARLGEKGGPSFAIDESGTHPTFAYWTLEALRAASLKLQNVPSVSLRALAAACGAHEVRWEGTRHFFNINTPEDLNHVAEHLTAHGEPD